MNTKLKTVLAAAFVVTATAAHAVVDDVINLNLVTNSGGPGGGPLNVTMDGTASSSTAAPLAYTGTKWNDLTFAGGTFNLLNSDNVAAGSLTSTGSASGWAINNGAGGSSPLTALNNYWFNITDFTISGLETDSVWDVYVFGEDNSANTGGNFTIGGSTQGTTGSADPLTQGTWVENQNYTIFSGVTAVGGSLSITRNSGAINGFQLIQIPEPSTYVMLAGFSALAFAAIRRRR